MRLAVTFALRLAVCAAVSWWGWRQFEAVGLLTTLPLLGVLLAKPLLDLASALRHRVRALAWQPVQGRHFTFRGIAVQVLEDERHQRWVRVADARKLVGSQATMASDGALKLGYPDGWRMLGRPPQLHLNDEALLLHLAKATTPEALKFRHWVERDIAFPARRLRERYGVKPEAD